ncbi:MAG: hypothetical protein HOP17_10265, partial [Acidobacteria bacterium]|nr:hypothetical protein [Acidobacteriota bacterium]
MYFAISYCYLAWWHGEIFLWNTLIHENGRLTLSGSLFYFDHFIACLPMIVLFSLFTAGGFALAGHPTTAIDKFRASFAAATLLAVAVLLILGSLAASIYTVGGQRTIDYALQRIERDGVMSTGGNWNQLQLSNVPIALGAISLSYAFIMFAPGAGGQRDFRLATGGKICIAVATILMIGISALTFPGWQAFLNPRWMAHSVRELATYPLTGIPIALIGILLAERYMSGQKAWVVKVGSISLIPIAVGLVIVAGQLIWLMNVDVMAMAQKPSFSADGLSIPYLLTSHVFEHFLDFVLICPLSGGIYALTR